MALCSIVELDLRRGGHMIASSPEYGTNPSTSRSTEPYTLKRRIPKSLYSIIDRDDDPTVLSPLLQTIPTLQQTVSRRVLVNSTLVQLAVWINTSYVKLSERASRAHSTLPPDHRHRNLPVV
ncbi:hypothetical protein LTR37_001422 [Vermiconidia calcicola]|uniref:Uncharacterized protein n=1 Tax=Vermiconidia calcicola TaxID=1690605 RepID=A0ACC3NVJ0_9PEZI|nr:hypothetical protein LTR37_001422 [Vermiconidia calcicola]